MGGDACFLCCCSAPIEGDFAYFFCFGIWVGVGKGSLDTFFAQHSTT